MAIDYAALLGATAGIRVAKADWDFTRDNGFVGTHIIPTQLIPSGSIVVGWLQHITEVITSGGAGYIDFLVGNTQFLTGTGGLGSATFGFPNGSDAIVADGGMPISAVIGTADLTAGAVTVYVFYVPT